jgi:AcrR family transcriptional regulator
MPRPEREAAMLDAAGEVFAAQGFHEASMDAIASVAGISKPMLYNYFGSKEGLYAAYIARSGTALLSVLRNASSPEAPAHERLYHGVVAFLTYVEEHRAGWSVLYSEAVGRAGPATGSVVEIRARLATIVSRVVAPELDDPIVRDALAHAFVGAGESLANWWLDHPSQSKQETAALLTRLITHP